jgi:hypothetical protein
VLDPVVQQEKDEAVTVRGYLVGDELADYDGGPAEMQWFEDSFRRINDHVHCKVCHGQQWAMRAFVWPRKGFGEFPLDFKPGLAPVVQSV